MAHVGMDQGISATASFRSQSRPSLLRVCSLFHPPTMRPSTHVSSDAAKKDLIQAHQTCPIWNSNGPRLTTPQKSSTLTVKATRQGCQFQPHRTAMFPQQHLAASILIGTQWLSHLMMARKVLQQRTRTSMHSPCVRPDALRGSRQILPSESLHSSTLIPSFSVSYVS